MRYVFVMVALMLGVQTADAGYVIKAVCTGNQVYRSNLVWAYYDGCAANIDAAVASIPATCTGSCVFEGSVVDIAIFDIPRGLADVFAEKSARSYGRKRGYPWGRSIVVLDMFPLGVGLDLAQGKSVRFAAGTINAPGTLMLRLYRRLSVGAFVFGYLPGAVAGREGGDVSGIGGNLRVALAGGAMSVKDRGDKSGYWELYVDGGFGPTFAQNRYEGGSGRAFSSALGLVVTTGWFFGIGLSTRFTMGRHAGATDAIDGGPPADIEFKSWDMLMAHILVLGI